MKHFLTYAIDAVSGNLVNINDVPRGLACGCVCPECKEPLIARRGDVRKPHFAHQANSKCKKQAAFESMIHLRSKEIIQLTNMVAAPAVIMDGKEIVKAGCFNFESVELEKEFENGLRPDCVGNRREYNGHKTPPVWIEIKNTHAVNEEKKAQIIKDGIYCLEIDVSQFYQDEMLDDEKLAKFLLADISNRVWINYPYTPPPTKQQVKPQLSSTYHATRTGFVKNRRL